MLALIPIISETAVNISFCRIQMRYGNGGIKLPFLVLSPTLPLTPTPRRPALPGPFPGPLGLLLTPFPPLALVLSRSPLDYTYGRHCFWALPKADREKRLIDYMYTGR